MADMRYELHSRALAMRIFMKRHVGARFSHPSFCSNMPGGDRYEEKAFVLNRLVRNCFSAGDDWRPLMGSGRLGDVRR
jgi:hypothetical protein